MSNKSGMRIDPWVTSEASSECILKMYFLALNGV